MFTTERKPRKIDLGTFYNLLYAPRNFTLGPHHYPVVSALEDPRINNLLIMGPPGTGKSNLLCIAYAAWEIGHDPELTTLSISAGEALPRGFMNAVMQIVQHDKIFREIFPDVVPDQGQGWSIERGLFVVGHPQTDPDANYKAVGLTSKALTGLHARLHIYDDIHDKENASTPPARKAVKDTYYNTLLGRADPRGTRTVAAGRWWAPDDVYQEWISTGDWVVMQLPAERPGSHRLWYDVFVPKTIMGPDGDQIPFTCVFNETLEPNPVQDAKSPYARYKAYYSAIDKTGRGFYWPGSLQKRTEYERTKRREPRTAAINYNGDMTGGGESIFNEDDFVPYVPPEDLSIGVQSPFVKTWVRQYKGEIEEAWDTALGQPQSASMTCAVTGMFVPCTHWHRGEDPALVGECDFHYDVYLLDVMTKDLKFDELTMELRRRHGKWFPRRIIVEEKQSGVGLLQIFRGTHIPVWGQKVEQGKVERAVNSILADGHGQPIGGGAASVQGWARMGRVRVPGGAPWLEASEDGKDGFLKKVCAYSGGSKAADEFDALVHLVTRAITLSRKQGYIPGMDEISGQTLQQNMPPPYGYEDSRVTALEQFQHIAQVGMSGSTANPFDGMCGAPCHYYKLEDNAMRCKRHDRVTVAISGCDDWVKAGSVKEDR
jgi:hypothetical protein